MTIRTITGLFRKPRGLWRLKVGFPLIVGVGGLLFATSCSEWLDVSPKTQIKSDDNFASEQGYKDALTGVYLLMAQTPAYGQELTYGMLDAMAQYYTGMAQNNQYQYDMAFDYQNSGVEGRIAAVWRQMYTAIANDNELISRIDQADPAAFAGRNYHLIRGEAYGLRALLHFDLARLWGEPYAKNPQHKCVPYMTSLTADVTPLSTVADVLEKCLADLSVAERELAVDPVRAGMAGEGAVATPDESYERDRGLKLHYYAVCLLQARIYLYMGRHAEALAKAMEVVEQQTFYFTPDGEINVAETAQRNRIFSEELLFALYDTSLRSRYSTYFTSDNMSSLIMSEASYQAVYELFKPGFSGDYRYAYQTQELDGKYYSTKYMQPSGGNTNYMFRIPMLRLSEAYYVAAECQLRQHHDVAAAMQLLNTVRSHRNLTDGLSLALTEEEAQEEIWKEYVKEFMGEGQLYYYYKRLNYGQIPIPTASGGTVSYSYQQPDYVWQLPDDEVEYGGRAEEN